MDNSYTASTVEMSDNGLDDLKDQLANNKTKEPAPAQNDVSSKEKRKEPLSKKYLFKKGDQSLELDEDFEIEIMADKKPTKMTLRELKDRAAGDVAVKNRMHSLAEEKKRVQSTFKRFAEMAKTDPLGALEFISGEAKEADTDFEYNNYLEKLAEQAEKIGKMTEEERKFWEKEKKVNQKEQDLSRRERENAVVLRKQEILTEYPGIGDSEFSEMVDAVLSNDELLDGMEDENDVMDRVEELVQETLTQRDIITVINELNPDYRNDTDLIFSMSDILRQNPDLDEEDVRDILGEIIKPSQRKVSRAEEERDRDIRTLSNKARQAAPVQQMRQQNMTPYELLAQQLREKNSEINKTPLNKR